MMDEHSMQTLSPACPGGANSAVCALVHPITTEFLGLPWESLGKLMGFPGNIHLLVIPTSSPQSQQEIMNSVTP